MEAVATEGLLGKLGIDVRLLVAQGVNFLIVLLVLSRFVFRPLLATMRKRSARIAQGLSEADRIAQEKKAFVAWRHTEEREVRDKTAALLTKAEEEARHRRDTLIRTAEAEAEAMHDRATAEADRLRREALESARRDVGALVVDVAERVLDRRLPSAERRAFMEDAVDAARKQAGAA